MDLPEQDLDLFGEDSRNDDNGPRRSGSSSPSSSSGSSSSSSFSPAAASSSDGTGGGQCGSSASSGEEEEENCGETADSRFCNENDEKGFYGHEETDLFGSDNEDHVKTLAIRPYPIPDVTGDITSRAYPLRIQQGLMDKLDYHTEERSERKKLLNT